jgi:hypothetical protein
MIRQYNPFAFVLLLASVLCLLGAAIAPRDQ